MKLEIYWGALTLLLELLFKVRRPGHIYIYIYIYIYKREF